MISGLGLDVVAVARMERLWQRYGDRLAQRLLAASELEEYHENAFKGRFLARHFAAKEAALKALGSGLSGGLRWAYVSVEHDSNGRPFLCFDKVLRQRFKYFPPCCHLSISDERDYAAAVVLLSSAQELSDDKRERDHATRDGNFERSERRPRREDSFGGNRPSRPWQRNTQYRNEQDRNSNDSQRQPRWRTERHGGHSADNNRFGGGERRPDRFRGAGERRPYGGGERVLPQQRDREQYPSSRPHGDRGNKAPYRGGSRPPFGRGEGNERRPYAPRDRFGNDGRGDGGAGNRPRRDGAAAGNRSPYQKRDGGGGAGNRSPYQKRDGGGRSPYQRRDGGGRPPYQRRDGGGTEEQFSYDKREGRGDNMAEDSYYRPEKQRRGPPLSLPEKGSQKAFKKDADNEQTAKEVPSFPQSDED